MNLPKWLAPLLLCLWPLCIQSQTVNITYNVLDFGLTTNSVQRVGIIPIARGGDYTNALLAPTPMRPDSWTGGVAVFSNKVSGYAYAVLLETPFSTTRRTNYFPTGLSGNVNGFDYQAWIAGFARDGSVLQWAWQYQTNLTGILAGYATTNQLSTTSNALFEIASTSAGGVNVTAAGASVATTNAGVVTVTTTNASGLSGGTLPDARLTATLQSLGTNNAAPLTNIPAAELTGTIADERLSGNATTMLVTGTVQDERISATMARRGENNTFSQTNLFQKQVTLTNAPLLVRRQFAEGNSSDSYEAMSFHAGNPTNDAWWSWIVATYTNENNTTPGGEYDYTLTYGYNPNGSPRYKTNLPSLFWGFESDYKPPGGARQAELYLIWNTFGRVEGWSLSHDNETILHGWNYKRFDFNGSNGSPALTIDRSGTDSLSIQPKASTKITFASQTATDNSFILDRGGNRLLGQAEYGFSAIGSPVTLPNNGNARGVWIAPGASASVYDQYLFWGGDTNVAAGVLRYHVGSNRLEYASNGRGSPTNRNYRPFNDFSAGIKSIYAERTLAATAGAYSEIGYYTNNNWQLGIVMLVEVSNFGNGGTAHYIIPINQADGQSTTWKEVLPIANGLNTAVPRVALDFAGLTFKSCAIRLRNLSTNAETCRVTATVYADDTNTEWITQTGTGTGATVASHYRQTALTQVLGNVGIGTNNPAKTFHVVGGILVSNIHVNGTGGITNQITTWRTGTGSPEGAVVGAIGDYWTRSDGGAGTTLYVKESGTGNTGWVAVNPSGSLSTTNAGSVNFVLAYVSDGVYYWKEDVAGTGGSDSTAIHDDTGGEIEAIADKATPTVSDHLLIEDTAASNAKKDITIGSLEPALEGVIDLQDLQGAVTDSQVPNTITIDLAATAHLASYVSGTLSNSTTGNAATATVATYIEGTFTNPVATLGNIVAAGNVTAAIVAATNRITLRDSEGDDIIVTNQGPRIIVDSTANPFTTPVRIGDDGIGAASFTGNGIGTTNNGGGVVGGVLINTNNTTLLGTSNRVNFPWIDGNVTMTPQTAPTLDVPGALAVQTNFWSTPVHGLKMFAGSNVVVFPGMDAGDVGDVAEGKVLKFNANGTMSPADDLNTGATTVTEGTNGIDVVTVGNDHTIHFNGTLTSSNLTGGIGGFGIKRGADPVLWATTNTVTLYDRTGTNAIMAAGNNTNVVGIGTATAVFDGNTPRISFGAPVTMNTATFNSLTVGTHYTGITNATVLGTDANGILEASAVSSFSGAVVATNGFASYTNNRADLSLSTFLTAAGSLGGTSIKITNLAPVNVIYYVSAGTNVIVGQNDLLTIFSWANRGGATLITQPGEWICLQYDSGASPMVVRKPF